MAGLAVVALPCTRCAYCSCCCGCCTCGQADFGEAEALDEDDLLDMEDDSDVGLGPWEGLKRRKLA